MKNSFLKFALIAIVMVLISSYQKKESNDKEEVKAEKEITSKLIPLKEKVLTADEQKALTPDVVIQRLKE